ncbi:hypothetical protein PBI_SCTP2_319 [Salicola phage SCTP-2]|nr:hypothetical protein PBI_SCTP2_319 [Salicola phage SCTP-2]
MDNKQNIGFGIDFNGDVIPIKPCINCGKHDFEMIDTLYPENRERTRWVCGCMAHNCGCGRQVYGQSKEEAIQRWNSGAIDEIMY